MLMFCFDMFSAIAYDIVQLPMESGRQLYPVRRPAEFRPDGCLEVGGQRRARGTKLFIDQEKNCRFNLQKIC